jgi:hypothetical protein
MKDHQPTDAVRDRLDAVMHREAELRIPELVKYHA